MNRTSTALPRKLAAVVLSVGLLCTAAAQAQTIDTFAGNGTAGFSGDGGPATGASLNRPYDVAVDGAGNRYIADTFNSRIRKVTPDGIINTIAGNGTPGFSGDGGPATSAQLSFVYQLAVDAGGTLYFADYINHRIRKVTPDGIINTIAGNGTPGFSGDGGPATSATMRFPLGIAVDDGGNVYFGDYLNARIRKVTPDGIINTIAGNGIRGFSGDGGPATSAALNLVIGLSLDGVGNLYLADLGNYRIRKVAPDGIITTVAGNGTLGFSGDGGPATRAALNSVWDVAADSSGSLYLADAQNQRIRKVTPDGIINTIAGNGIRGFSGDGGSPTLASMRDPSAVAIDVAGDVYIADLGNHRVRKVALFTSCAAEAFTGSKLALCRQICEVDHSPTALAGLVNAWMSAFRSEPPCAR